jgi:TIGR03009 family protein
MHPLILSLTILLGIAAGVYGQQEALHQPIIPKPQAPPPKLDPAHDPLDWVLVNWEKKMAEITSYEAKCVRINEDRVWRKKSIYEGTAKYLKTPTASLARLRLEKANRPDDFEEYIFTGTVFYRFDPEQKLIWVHDAPKVRPGQVSEFHILGYFWPWQVSEFHILDFLFGMKAAQAKQHFKLEYIAPPADDKYYYFIMITPKNDCQKEDFIRARLVVLRSNFMIAQLWYEEPNGNEITWNFSKIVSPAKLDALEFQQPTPPAGWQLRKVPKMNSQPGTWEAFFELLANPFLLRTSPPE